jgi:hypothetical protein
MPFSHSYRALKCTGCIYISLIDALMLTPFFSAGKTGLHHFADSSDLQRSRKAAQSSILTKLLMSPLAPPSWVMSLMPLATLSTTRACASIGPQYSPPPLCQPANVDWSQAHCIAKCFHPGFKFSMITVGRIGDLSEEHCTSYVVMIIQACSFLPDHVWKT